MKTLFFVWLILITATNFCTAQESISVAQDPGNDVSQSATPIYLRNRGLNGTTYSWGIYTAAVGGGSGIKPNAFEIWEYPPSIVNPTCCMQRFSIDKANGNPSPFIIDKNGGLALGGYPDAGNSFLAVNGNVGIGTSDTKGYKLAVAGNMIAESVKVKLQVNWPDYVFAEDYDLLSLKETEKQIKEQGHLPGIPSATEVKVNGIDLGDMNAKLLQKIEELTLHLIEKDKEIKGQNNLISELKDQLKDVKKDISQVKSMISKLNDNP